MGRERCRFSALQRPCRGGRDAYRRQGTCTRTSAKRPAVNRYNYGKSRRRGQGPRSTNRVLPTRAGARPCPNPATPPHSPPVISTYTRAQGKRLIRGLDGETAAGSYPQPPFRQPEPRPAVRLCLSYQKPHAPKPVSPDSRRGHAHRLGPPGRPARRLPRVPGRGHGRLRADAALWIGPCHYVVARAPTSDSDRVTMCVLVARHPQGPPRQQPAAPQALPLHSKRLAAPRAPAAFAWGSRHIGSSAVPRLQDRRPPRRHLPGRSSPSCGPRTTEHADPEPRAEA